jgi:hypothetical protein
VAISMPISIRRCDKSHALMRCELRDCNCFEGQVLVVIDVMTQPQRS